MISRRLLLTGLSLPVPTAAPPVPAAEAALPVPAAAAALPVPVTDRLTFQVMRNGSAAGQHTITFKRLNNTLTVLVATEIAAGAGPIALFRYKHRAEVLWKNGQVVAVDAETNDNGTPEYMTARRDENGLTVEGSRTPRYIAPPRSLPGTHWNRAMLDAPFINTQDGRLMHPVVAFAGTERLDVVGGSVDARHYILRGDVNLDTFYDLGAVWAGLKSTGKDESEIKYLRA